jgi:hypothetical protein
MEAMSPPPEMSGLCPNCTVLQTTRPHSSTPFMVRVSWDRISVQTAPKIFLTLVFFLSFLGWGETESTWYVGHFWPTVPAPDGGCGAVGGMRIGRGNRSTRKKPAPVLLSSPQIPHDQTQARTRNRRGGRPATNRLSYRMAYLTGYVIRK